MTREEIERRRKARKIEVWTITDPVELARREEQHKAARLLYDGTDMVVTDALYAIAQGAKRGRNLLNVVAKLCAHLTPEQQLGLAERLPDILSPEARAALASRLAAPARG
jgi:hypothetical protein